MISYSRLLEEAKSLSGYTIDLRREFHKYPEIGFKEVRTSGIIDQQLRQMGYEVANGIARTGVAGVLGDHPAASVLLRFDMDALPIQEETGAEYASVNPGVMHACGHDGHMAVGLTAAKIFRQYQQELAGSVKLVFQPAEEGLGGARQMIAEGVLDQPGERYSLAMHLWNEKPAGWFGISKGPVMAGSDALRIKITGRGGHGALPQQVIDPLVAAAQIITALQSIISRNLSPLQSAVISVTQLKAGETHNVVPQCAELKGTIRTFEAEVRQKVISRLEQIVKGIASAMECQAEVEVEELTPPVVNDAGVAEKVAGVARRLFPDAKIVEDYQTTVSEDMALFLDRLPGCFVFVGSANPEKGLHYGHHHPKFDFDESALPPAAALLTAATFELMKDLRG